MELTLEENIVRGLTLIEETINNTRKKVDEICGVQYNLAQAGGIIETMFLEARAEYNKRGAQQDILDKLMITGLLLANLAAQVEEEYIGVKTLVGEGIVNFFYGINGSCPPIKVVDNTDTNSQLPSGQMLN